MSGAGLFAMKIVFFGTKKVAAAQNSFMILFCAFSKGILKSARNCQNTGGKSRMK